jgi:hypothetical protein
MVASIASLKVTIIACSAFAVGSWAATTYSLHARHVTIQHLVHQVDELRDVHHLLSETTSEIALHVSALEGSTAHIGSSNAWPTLNVAAPEVKTTVNHQSKPSQDETVPPPAASPAIRTSKADTARPPAPLLTITSPADNSVVMDDTLASGTCSPSIAGDIWVFVWPGRAPGKGWPQSPDADKGAPATRNQEKWSTPISFGGPPQSYEIAVYVATPAASRRLSELLAGWARRNSYPGMTIASLPQGLVENQRIRVTKR